MCVCVYAGFNASFGTKQIMVYHNNVLSLTYIVHHGTTQTRDIQDDSRVNARHRWTPRLRNQAGSTTKLGENDESFKGRSFQYDGYG